MSELERKCKAASLPADIEAAKSARAYFAKRFKTDELPKNYHND